LNGIHLRPGVEHLRKLLSNQRFTLGVFSSATKPTVEASKYAIFKHTQVSFKISLCRHHCIPVHHMPELCGSKTNPWDTIKPLSRYFAKKDPHSHYSSSRHGYRVGMDKVILVDDELAKVHPSERGNLIHIPSWESTDGDDRLKVLVDSLLTLPHVLDTREHTSRISTHLWERTQKI